MIRRLNLSAGWIRPACPEEWETVKIRQISTIVGGGRLRLTKERDYRSNGFPAFSAAGQDGFVELAEFRSTDAVVLSSIGALCGKCFLAEGDWTTLANVQIIVPAPAVLARYLHYRVNRDDYWPRSGSAQPFIKPRDVGDCWIAYPPLGEQRKIADILGAIDAALRETERLVAKLKLVKQGLLHDLLTRGIDDNGELRNPDRHPEQFKDSPLGRIPNDWNAERLGALSRGGGIYGSNVPALPFDPALPRYVRITDMSDDGILSTETLASITHEQAAGSLLAEGDLLFARSGATVGKTHLYRSSDGLCAHAGYVIRFQIHPERADPEFVYQWTKSAMFSAWVGRTLRQGAQPNINATEYARHVVPCPPVTEQRRIAHLLRTLDLNLQLELDSWRKLRLLKQALMDDLLTGCIRVTPLLKGNE